MIKVVLILNHVQAGMGSDENALLAPWKEKPDWTWDDFRTIN